jgi:hypothetical protein
MQLLSLQEQLLPVSKALAKPLVGMRPPHVSFPIQMPPPSRPLDQYSIVFCIYGMMVSVLKTARYTASTILKTREISKSYVQAGLLYI